MGAFGQVAQSIGGIGNDTFTAQQDVASANQTAMANRLANLTATLNLRKLQMSLGQQPTDPFSQKVAAIEKLLGRPLTDPEKETIAGVAKADAPPPGIKYADVKTDTTGRQYGLSSITGRYELIPGQDGVTFPVPGADSAPGNRPPTTKTFNGFEWQFDPDKAINGPRDPTGQYVQLGPQKTPPLAESPSKFDASIQAAAAGNINPPSPSTKAGAAWWKQAQELGLADQIKTRSFATPRTVDAVAAAQKAYESELDKYNRWTADNHFFRYLSENPYAETLAAKRDALNLAKGAAGGASPATAGDNNFGGSPAPR